MNLAHLAKQAWRIIQDLNSLWVQILKAKYFPQGEFLRAKSKRDSSWIWHSILQGRDLLLAGGRWVVGDGKTIRMWEDKWIQADIKHLQSRDSSDTLLDTIIDETTKKWDFAKVRQLFPSYVAKQVVQIPLSYTNIPDQFI